MPSIKARYARIEIPLNKAETGKELFLTGDYLSVVSITGEGSCNIKLDHRHSQSIDLREVSGVSGVFDRIYLTTDGEGGTVILYIGTGMAIHVAADPQKLKSGGTVNAQVTTSNTVVTCLANELYNLRDVTILNSNGIYSCYVGAYNPTPATFRAYAYVLLPHKTLHFTFKDMYTLGIISYNAVNNVIIDIIGTYD
jgi:hypothetical protein